MSLPYYITRSTLLQHAMIHGATGSGKTSLILIPMFEQLILMAGRDRDSSIIILDQKGDRAFMESMRRAAVRAGLPFRWMTTKLRHSTYGFNPFLQKHFHRDLTRNQAAEMFAKSFGLDFGQIYGGSYFRDMAVLVLRALLELPEIDSFAKLSNYAKNHPEFFELPKKTAEQTTHLRAALDALSTIEPLNVTAETHAPEVIDNAIDIGDTLSEPQVLYFYLPSTLEDLVCFTIAKLVGYLLLTAAAMRPDGERKKVFLCIDEFQRVASQDFTVFVQQARGFDVGCILSSQTTADLDTAGTNFAEVLEENTITKIDLTGLGKQQSQRMVDQSSMALTRVFGSVKLENSLTADELTRMSAAVGEGTIRVAIPHGLTQCGGHQVRFKAMYHVSKSEYDDRRTTPWPDTANYPGTIVNRNPRDPDEEGLPGEPGDGSDSPRTNAAATDSSLTKEKSSVLAKLAARILRDEPRDEG